MLFMLVSSIVLVVSMLAASFVFLAGSSGSLGSFGKYKTPLRQKKPRGAESVES